MSHILVSGSIAYDFIMDFHDSFANYILPEHTHMLSVNFNINEMSRNEGGAGHNIAYNLSLLGERALLMGAVGEEFIMTPWNKDHIDYRYTVVSETLGTPSAHIITDQDNNQITAFYPGASVEARGQHVSDVKEDIKIAIVSPNDPLAMLQHLEQCYEKNIPVIFDPGQPLSAFSKEQLHRALAATTYLIVNEYELELLCKLADLHQDELVNMVEAYIVTLGAKGSQLVTAENETVIVPALFTENVVDPTGAGDAYRAGVLWALAHGKGWEEGMQIGTVLSHTCIQYKGTQIHSPTFEEVQSLAQYIGV